MPRPSSIQLLAVLCALLLAAACVTESGGGADGGTGSGGTGGDGDGDAPGDGDGDAPGDGDGGDGDGGDGDGGDGDGGDGDGIGGSCIADTDCLAVGNTNDACYSVGCSLPVAASKADAAADACLVPWAGDRGPDVPVGCGSDVPTPCTLACAAPPTCIDARCVAGECTLSITQDGSDCTAAGGTPGQGDCSQLETRRQEAVDAARQCIPDGIIAECVAGDSIPGPCGCPIPVNENRRNEVAAARAAYEAWNAACEPPMNCQLIDCQSAQDTASCERGAGGGTICVW